jgi:hypothetical protein
MSRMRRTRFQCAGCGVPLCLIGNGKVDNDCFTIAHETAERQELVCKKYDKMKTRNRRQHVQNLTRILVVVSVINNSSLLMGWQHSEGHRRRCCHCRRHSAVDWYRYACTENIFVFWHEKI